MRIGLYGLPAAGKTFVLDQVSESGLEVLQGSRLLEKIRPDFSTLAEPEREQVRKTLAVELKKKDHFIMDGHYAFGETVVFTEEDGALYDAFVYLYIAPQILQNRMQESPKNRKYLQYDIEKWQKFEVESLRSYCQKHQKDFYVIDHPKEGYFSDIRIILAFLHQILCGFSGVAYARRCVEEILATIKSDSITLFDGDQTLICKDSSRMLGYQTHLFDNCFYTGFQSWRHMRELTFYLDSLKDFPQILDTLDFHWNKKVIDRISKPAVILTSGHPAIWKRLASKLAMPCYYGEQMSADTKYLITAMLQEKGKYLSAYGDSMNDYYMLRQADRGYLVVKPDRSISTSLKGRDLEGLLYV